MASPLVETKLFIPRLRRSVVARPAADGAPEPRGGGQADAGLRTGRLRQDHAADRLAGRRAAASDASVAWVSLDESDRQPAVVLDLRGHRPADGRARRRRRRAPAAAVGPAADRDASSPPCSTSSARCRTSSTWSSTTTTSPTGPTSRPGMAFLLDHLPPQVHLVISTRADPALPLARLRARGELVEVRAADLRFTPDEVGGLPQRRHRPGPRPRATSPPWRTAPKAGSPPCSWPRCRCRDAATSPASSPGSPATTGTSSTTSSRRSWTGSPTRSAASCSRPPSWTGSPARCATPSPASTAARRCWRRWTARTCSWSRSTTAAAGTATTTSSPTSCRPTCSTNAPDEVADLHRRASHWYDQNGRAAPAVRHALAAGDVDRAADLVELAIPALRRNRQEARSVAGWTHSPTRSSGSGRCSPSASSAR